MLRCIEWAMNAAVNTVMVYTVQVSCKRYNVIMTPSYANVFKCVTLITMNLRYIGTAKKIICTML